MLRNKIFFRYNFDNTGAQREENVSISLKWCQSWTTTRGHESQFFILISHLMPLFSFLQKIWVSFVANWLKNEKIYVDYETSVIRLI